MIGVANITTVSEEDRKFIQDISKLSKEKKDLVKGIVIGLQLEEQQSQAEGRKHAGLLELRGCS